MRHRQVAVLLVLAAGAGAEEAVRKIADLDHAPLAEVSGIARSSYDGLYWVHNDSGDAARLFAIDEDGEPAIPSFLAHEDRVWQGLELVEAANVDWEDIARGRDMLYVADLGNNGNARRDLGVYVVPEPNPRAVAKTRPLRFLPVRYPDQEGFPAEQWHFDSEALFVDRGRLYVLTKHRAAARIDAWQRGTKLYRLELETARADAYNLLERVSSRDDLMLVTAADLSPDGERLAVLTYVAVWLFDRPEDGGDWLSGRASVIPLDRARTRIAEAVTWRDDETLIVANENRELFAVRVEAAEPAAE